MKPQFTHTEERSTGSVVDVCAPVQEVDTADTRDSLSEENPSTSVWLSWQCQMITGTEQGEIFQVTRTGHLSTTTDRWPSSAEDCPALVNVAKRAFEVQQALKERTAETQGASDDFCYVAQPVFIDQDIVAVVAFKLMPRSEIQLRAVLQLINWGVSWLAHLIRNQKFSTSNDSTVAMDFAQILLRSDDLRDIVVELCDAISLRYECDRVSIGVTRGISTRLMGITQNVDLLHNSSLQQDLEAAMTEACDFRKPVFCPDPENPALCHQALSRRQGMNTIYTQPMRSEDVSYGAITLERTEDRKLSSSECAELAVFAPMLGHQLRLMVQREYSLGQRSVRLMKRIGHAKYIALLLLLFLVALSIIPGTYRVDSNATVEGAQQRAIVAPVDGYIAQSFIRAGDSVKQDAILAKLEDRDLNLERRKWQSEYERNSKSYIEALATQQRAQSRIAEARLSETQAELDLVDERLHRANLRAPFDGIVVSGDFSQSLGTPVARGQILFEIAPLDNYHVVSEVHERDIAQITLGQKGQLRLMGMPDQLFSVTVTRIAPLATAEKGRTYFQVEARVDSEDSLIRPGMQGITKLNVGERPYLWIWTHRMWVQMRLWFWSLGV